MGVMRHSEVGYDKTLGLVAKRLREDSEQVTQEPLPTRWVDLILHLDEQERRTHAGSQPAGEEIVEAELAVRNQEKVLRELMRTEEDDCSPEEPEAKSGAGSCGPPVTTRVTLSA